MNLRKFTAAAGLAVLALLASACGKEGTPGTPAGGSGEKLTYQVAQNVDVAGSPTFQKMKQRGKVIIGVKDDQPNLGFKDVTTGKYEGFDVEIAKMIAAGLGFREDQIEFKTVPSPNREIAIQNGDIDYYVGTYSITDKRKQMVSFAGPYFITGQGLLVRKGETSINGPQDLAGKKVCSVQGSTPLQNIEKVAPQAQRVPLEKYSLCVEQLLQNQVDAVTTDEAILKGYAAQQPDKLKLVGEKFSTEKYGVGLPKDDKALRDKINDILEAAAKDGTWKKIYDATLGKSGTQDTPPPLERY
ncbi:ABC transporter substrate-binding protein [Carbonactinospora thermoautotrophica]|uniref:ABC transporter substrate-binding protein n=1 Tax=Carbonactinospora thermoautotrophica TaxID=1469144 RepID=A0A132MPU5_9ACTN|nr:glutamate ABC transporter substrate-binding protein [Carbonactinospora thermoautotrophica]KWW99755.1 ABC-type transporter [Carbonactinospora thermoautotrophica]KWX04487.1 ABC transporter substrate-binding protein [Carbonactinospora thermoautotrophica]KWX08980.1 ABC transporter substrate-binding protein [Carbonactinospora thermoautotrophica]MCX9191247.1 ABC transporter substrate-binding protein [Carbonactinospora thermoautotrophica]